MLIMVAGPYSTGGADSVQRAANLTVLNEAALRVFRRGHIPVIGVNAALPIIAVAGDTSYDEIMMPVSLALAERCDACLRIGGPSAGADAEVERFQGRGLPVYRSLDDIPLGSVDSTATS
ncbi:DUF4406 domain-containing protein [Azospirillum melinis]|uniref:DUF4406 domain-containing protein n=1 Tax=Azospirillum melinis TaxID=328839 RepID=A0ABX2KFD8_9PROT|nr:DUF4406 domain-containing protein [Azospirillum melinis]MBP2308934.1 hypothetical protein [Azospirillum melinis]NUA99334.1 DUF4406 domain-containing protein [Azospirillum melinis]